MIFWDSSAIVPLLLEEPSTARVGEVLKTDRHMVVWWGTEIECLSALARAERTGQFKALEADWGRSRLSELRMAWTEIRPSEEVRDRAGAALLRHALTAADALQLSAALTWVGARPRQHGLITLDSRLAAAARGEGFRLALPIDQ